ncbi:unnamed protein product [Spirodela intermedia]|uniref:Uncharacterized protein n=1 Tax=Spirodela intermedia TaxID=51605 RepID=A0A7I8IUN0_SPIIN|nr:unnamed protein product [Spirodela intermedia]CAA6661479.1 unnamed protein product [Spirodela intermedia]
MTFIIFYYLSLIIYYFIYIMRLIPLDFYETSWRRDYLECIKIVMDQTSLDLGLTHNKFQNSEKFSGRSQGCNITLGNISEFYSKHTIFYEF